MFKNISITIIFILLYAVLAFSTIHKVDKNTANNPDFTTLQDAHDGATDGDTLYVYGSGSHYGSLTLTKKLIIIGTGYFLDENPETQVEAISAICRQIIFESGSEGSIVSGMEITCSANMNIKTSNITLKRNKISTSNYSIVIIQIILEVFPILS